MPKAGFAAIIGKPNVGKSTLMNTLIGQKIAITSYKPQTTRNQIRTIYTDENGQIVFLDTPGILKAKDRLGRYMEKSAENAIRDVDVVLWLVEPKEKPGEEVPKPEPVVEAAPVVDAQAKRQAKGKQHEGHHGVGSFSPPDRAASVSYRRRAPAFSSS